MFAHGKHTVYVHLKIHVMSGKRLTLNNFCSTASANGDWDPILSLYSRYWMLYLRDLLRYERSLFYSAPSRMLHDAGTYVTQRRYVCYIGPLRMFQLGAVKYVTLRSYGCYTSPVRCYTAPLRVLHSAVKFAHVHI